MSGITHTFVSAIPDGGDATLVQPSNWNATHAIANGTVTEAMLLIAANTTGNVSTTAHGFAPILPNDATKFLNGAGAYSVPPAAATSLTTLSAATGAVTLASGNNTGIVWNWANTSDSTIAFTVGETSAATGGTSTSGVPNQVLVKLTTAAASTQSPLSVYSRAAHVFSVSPSVAQILGTNGVIGNPTYSFAGSVNTGMYSSGAGFLNFSAGGTGALILSNAAVTCSLPIRSGLGNAGAPSHSFTNATTTGLFGDSVGPILGVSVGGLEELRWSAGIYQPSHGSANAVSYAMNARKSRGTVAAPTVITTGDSLLTESGFGYVGATNTYQESTRVTHDSTGTISDATNGIGGIIRFSTKKQGTDAAVVERFRVDDAGHLISVAGTANTPTITAGGGTSPTIIGTDSAFTVTVGTGGLASSVEVTFGTAYTNAPVTSAQSDTDILALKSTPTTTKVTITAAVAFSAGSNIDCICIGRG